MTGLDATAALRRSAVAVSRVLIGAVFLACLLLPLTPQQVSACAVGYGYRPSPSFDSPTLGLKERQCPTGISLAGAAFLAMVVLTGIITAARGAYRRGAAIACGLTADTDESRALAAYLLVAGVATAESPEPDDNDDADGRDAKQIG